MEFSLFSHNSDLNSKDVDPPHGNPAARTLKLETDLQTDKVIHINIGLQMHRRTSIRLTAKSGTGGLKSVIPDPSSV